MAGLPGDIVLNPALNAKCQQAALMMHKERQLSHGPPASWGYFTTDGVEAAANSNIALAPGPLAIIGYISEPDAEGSNNPEVRHRRLILYPPQQTMGMGNVAVPGIFFAQGANALWVKEPGGPRPVGPEFVAWPPPGFVPWNMNFVRWSFSFPNADFSATTISVTKNGTPAPLNTLPLSTSFGDNTIVWEFDDFELGAPPVDWNFAVTVNNVMIHGSPRNRPTHPSAKARARHPRLRSPSFHQPPSRSKERNSSSR